MKKTQNKQDIIRIYSFLPHKPQYFTDGFFFFLIVREKITLCDWHLSSYAWDPHIIIIVVNIAVHIGKSYCKVK